MSLWSFITSVHPYTHLSLAGALLQTPTIPCERPCIWCNVVSLVLHYRICSRSAGAVSRQTSSNRRRKWLRLHRRSVLKNCKRSQVITPRNGHALFRRKGIQTVPIVHFARPILELVMAVRTISRYIWSRWSTGLQRRRQVPIPAVMTSRSFSSQRTILSRTPKWSLLNFS